MMPGPYSTGKPLEEVTLTGKFLPWSGTSGQPVLLMVPGCRDYFLPLFSTIDDLLEVLTRVDAPHDGINRVEDGADFLNSIPMSCGGCLVRVILDPWFTDAGTVQFVEVWRSAPQGDLC